MYGSNIRVGKIGSVSGEEKIPENAVVVSPIDILNLQERLINNWRPKSEMFSLKYGNLFLGGLSAASGCLIAFGFRSVMLLGGQARLVSLLPNSFLPCIFTFIPRELYLTNEIRLGNQCPTCLLASSSLIQVGAGVVASLGLAMTSSTYLAKNYSTYPLPPVKDYKALFKVYSYMIKAMKKPLIYTVFVNIFGASVVSFKQNKEISKVNEKIINEESTLV